MIKIEISCPDCSCEYTIEHEMDDERYLPQYCVFCQYEIIEDDLNFINIEDEEYE